MPPVRGTGFEQSLERSLVEGLRAVSVVGCLGLGANGHSGKSGASVSSTGK